MTTNIAEHKELLEMMKDTKRTVEALELCWKCQKITECQKYVLGQTVLVWMCPTCMAEAEKTKPVAIKTRAIASRNAKVA